MDHVLLGKSDLRVSRLCLGTSSYGGKETRAFNLDEQEARPFYKRALDLGINFFDTADIYAKGASETVLGATLKHFGIARDKVIIATKVAGPTGPLPKDRGLSRTHIMSAIDDSLRRLQTDYVDLYLIHRFDPETPVEETLAAFTDLIKAGKVRRIGASSMYAWQFAKLVYAADRFGYARPVNMQSHYNLAYREEEREMLPLCRSEGISVTVWSALARGLLAGNRGDGKNGASLRARNDAIANLYYNRPDELDVAARVAQMAAERGISRAQIALAWLLRQPGVAAPIVSATKLAQLDDAAAALSVNLSADDCKILEEPYQPHPVIGHSYEAWAEGR